MKRLTALGLVLCLLIIIAVPVSVFAAEADAIYVDASNGSDTNAGTAEKPLKTLKAARDRVRTMTDSQSGDITVYLREGTYFQEETLCLDERDSGQNGFDVVYKAYNGEKAVISGGKEITGWTLHDSERNIYSAPAQGIDTRGISVNGQRAQRARSADYPLSNVEKWSNIGITTTDTFMADWENIEDAELVFQNVWFNSRCGISKVEKSGGRLNISMDHPGWRYITTRSSYPVLEPEYIENAYELLDAPGEWYLNKNEDTFYYMPRKGEDMSEAEVYAWVLETIISVQGTSLDTPAHNIRFEDLIFKHTTYLRPNSKSGHSDSQNNYVRNQEEGHRDHLIEGGVEVECANNIPFTGCEFTELGGLGLRLRNGVRDSPVTGCHFHHIDGGGLAIGEGSAGTTEYYNPPDERLYMVGNHVKNNYIHATGRAFRSSSGISLGYVVDTEVSHNDIEDMPYCGIHAGYGWDNFVSILRGLKITNNYIQNVLNEKMYDGGAIYTNGMTSGSLSNMNVIAENFIKDYKNNYAGIYQDNGSSFYRIERNVIDNYNYPKSPTNSPSYNWLLATSNGISLHYIDNYTAVSENQSARDKKLKATDMRLEGTTVVPDCMWDETALSIIAKAGMEKKWKERWGGIDMQAIDKMIMDAEISLAVGEEYEANPVLIDNSGRVIDAEITYTVKNPDIVGVRDGKLYGKARGVTEVIVKAENSGRSKEKIITATVGDIVTYIEINPKVSKMYVGDRILLEENVLTLLGNTLKDSNVTFEALNPEIANVTAEGYLEAYAPGKCRIAATVVAKDKSFTENIDFTVIPLTADKGIEEAVNSSGLGVKVYSMNSDISNTAGWQPPATNAEATVTPDTGKVTVATPGSSVSGYANYVGKKFGNELLNFNLKINGTDSWYALALRNQTTNSPIGGGTSGSSAYVIVINPGSIELHRYNDAVRTVFYGNLEGFVSKAGDAVVNKKLSYNEEHEVQVGAVNTEDGVLIILMVDGEVVFWHLDNSEDAITEPGYFSLISRKGSMEFINPTQKEFTSEGADVTAGNSSSAYNDVAGHWAGNEIAYLSAKGIFQGDDKGSFRPEGQITRAEALAALLRTMNVSKSAFRGALGDIEGTEWYAGYIQAALEQGYINEAMLGDGDTISPNQPITREEIAGVISAVLGGGSGERSAEEYSDFSEVSDSYRASVNHVAAEGIMTGQTETELAPKKTLTRAEAATVIYRLTEKLSK